MSNRVQLRVLVSGLVQGVGFRYWTKNTAADLGLAGYVLNLDDGRVEAVMQGSKDTLNVMLEKLYRGPTHAKVTQVEEEWGECGEQYQDFRIKR